jgi:hypothetical protein
LKKKNKKKKMAQAQPTNKLAEEQEEREFPMPPLEGSSGDEREDDDDADDAPRPLMARVRVMADQQAWALVLLRDAELAFKKRLETQQRVPEEEEDYPYE